MGLREAKLSQVCYEEMPSFMKGIQDFRGRDLIFRNAFGH
jgi:hypothetical protein